ncbi:MAG: hypothetical protein Q4G13_01785, partial [Moraxella sp.]|nr:hypothetical protein [Moraxella sp.]
MGEVHVFVIGLVPLYKTIILYCGIDYIKAKIFVFVKRLGENLFNVITTPNKKRPNGRFCIGSADNSSRQTIKFEICGKHTA